MTVESWISKKSLKRKIAGFVLLNILLFSSIFVPVSRDSLFADLGFSFEIYDRHDNLLRKGLSTAGFYFSPIKYSDLPSYLREGLIAFEDRNFYVHGGVDVTALMRAVYFRIYGKGQSGGSTITMQIARNVNKYSRNIFAKIFEAWYALRIENSYSKKDILTLYFNTIPFGKQIIGVEMASRIYFNKSVKTISPAQAAFLIAAVKYPGYIYDKNKIKKVIFRQKLILQKLYREKIISQSQFRFALQERIILQRFDKKMLAPHFVDFLLRYLKNKYPDNMKSIYKIYTTLDMVKQRQAEKRISNTIATLKDKHISNGASLVVDNATSDLLVMVGSVDYYKNSSSGQVNGTLAIRSPGSALKPFTYGVGIELGLFSPATVFADVPTDLYTQTGDYTPENYSHHYNGPVSLRKALGCSYNIPAIAAIVKLGFETVYDWFKSCGFDSLTEPAGYYGVTLTLGGGNVSLYELTRAYAMLANKGIYRELNIIRRLESRDGSLIPLKRTAEQRKVFSPETAFLLGNILSDNDARSDSFSELSPLNFDFFVAAKTGTSKGYRDNWTVGYSKKYTIGCWSGNFDSSSMEGVSGISGAAVIFRKLMLAYENDRDYKPAIPENIVQINVCPVSGKLCKQACGKGVPEYFKKAATPKSFCSVHWLVPYQKGNGRILYQTNNQRADYRKIELLPAVYEKWLIERGQSLPSKEIMHWINWRKSGKLQRNIKVRFPDSGDSFIIDPILPRSSQVLVFRGTVPPDTEKVRWYLNDKIFYVNEYPFNYSWKIESGVYKLKIEAENGKEKIVSRSIRFVVK